MSWRARVLTLALCLLVSGCSGGSTPRPTLVVREIDGVGPVLATDSGQALYVFAPDARRSVTCHDQCAGTWPPLFTASGGTAAVAGGARADLVAADDDQGHRVVTYGGWPLYTYLPDRPGHATGQAIDLNGGYWYVLRADGTPLVPAGQPPLQGR